MRLLIVGSDRFYSIERHYIKYFRELGVEVDIFRAQEMFMKQYSRSIVAKILHKLGLSRIFSNINKAFLQKVVEYQPEIILIFKGMEITLDSLLQVKSKGIKLVNYNPDNPFLFSGKGSGNKNITEGLAAYDGFATYDDDIREQFEALYAAPTFICPFGFNYSDAEYQAAISVQEINRLCFIGNPDVHRAEFIQSIAEHYPVTLFGNGWSNFVEGPNFEIFGEVTNNEFWTRMRQYRIQLNLMRPHNPNSHNMRTFEVPGIGGILLSPATRDHKRYFVGNENLFTFENLNDCLETIGKLLKLSKEEADRFRTNTMSWSFEQGYHYKQRAHNLSEFLRLVLEGKKL